MGISFFTAAVTISSDFGAQDNKACHCFHCFCMYLPWSNGMGCHDLHFFFFLVCTYHIKTILKKKKCKNVVWEGLTNNLEKKRSKRQRRKERHTHLNADFHRIARRDYKKKKSFLTDQCKEIEENNTKVKTKDLLRKLHIGREYFMQRWAQERTKIIWT